MAIPLVIISRYASPIFNIVCVAFYILLLLSLLLFCDEPLRLVYTFFKRISHGELYFLL
jgi:hypothetical protein